MPNEFNEFVLNEHNTLRAKHGAPPLTLSAKLNQVAQGLADNCSKAGTLKHSNSHYGENLYMMSSSQPVPDKDIAKNACESWYNEIRNYKFGSNENQKGCGHLTQLLWRDSKELGVGRSETKKAGGCYVACVYEPAGNFLGKFAVNVLPIQNQQQAQSQ